MQAAPFECVINSGVPLAQCAPPPSPGATGVWVSEPWAWALGALALYGVAAMIVEAAFEILRWVEKRNRR